MLEHSEHLPEYSSGLKETKNLEILPKKHSGLAHFWAVYGFLSSAFFIGGSKHIAEGSTTEGAAELVCGVGVALLGRHMYRKVLSEQNSGSKQENEDYS